VALKAAVREARGRALNCDGFLRHDRAMNRDPSALTEIYMIESSYHSYYTGDGRFP